MKSNKFFIILILILVSNIAFAMGNGMVGLIIQPPINEGEGPLLVYYIEYKKSSETIWKEAGTQIVIKVNDKYANQEYIVKNLEIGEDYDFRVKVENLIGIGEAGEIKRKITALEDGPKGIKIRSGDGRPGKSRSSFILSNSISVNKIQETKLLYKKED